MSALEVVNLIVMILLGGFLTFLATQLVKQKSWPSWVKLVLSLVMAAIFALATAWQAGDLLNIALAWNDLTAEAIMAYFVTYWTAATVWYKVVFKGTDWINALGAWPKAPS